MTKTKNKYCYPIDFDKMIRMTYSESPAHRNRLKHAVDFIVPERTPFKAALDGVVADVKQDSDIGGPDESYDQYGNYIEIEHPGAEYSIYEHMQKNGSLVIVGDKVRKGQTIGYSGNTGWIAHLGPHIHFDVHKYFGEGHDDYETLEIVWQRR